MQTRLADFIRATPDGRIADAELRKCVHCGFCTATCPTYQLFGDELDGPRGRIYLMKELLEGRQVSARTQRHLDRCLTCRACETTCPSGVEYHRLLDVGRAVMATRLPRPLPARLGRALLRGFLTRRWLFTPAYRLGQFFRPLLPPALKAKVLARKKSVAVIRRNHPRRMLMLAGCVQPAMMPQINRATARVLDRLGIAVEEIREAGCCGAIRLHLDDRAGARADARRNIDAWWPHLEDGAEAIVLTASGCGAQVRDYGYLLADDAAYAHKAQIVSQRARDIAEILADEQAALGILLADAQKSVLAGRRRRVFHAPCTLQHALGVFGLVENILENAGCELAPVADAHLCCGSAGTYSLFQAQIARQLRDNKLACLHAGAPQEIASANIGCIAHLQAGTALPVCHWIEWIDELLAG